MASYRGEEIDLNPTSSMADEAERGLEWRREFGRGGTAVGIARARDIAGRKELSPRTVRRMVSFFARHEVDKQAEGFSPGEKGYPSNGRIAWALWGGDPGKSWSESKAKALDNIDEAKDFAFSDEDCIVSQRYLEVSAAMPTKMLHQTVRFEVKEIQEDGQFYVFEGYASTFGNVDRGGDVVEKGAFLATIQDCISKAIAVPGTGYKKLLPILWQHKTSEPVGSFIEMREDDAGLYVKGIMPKSDTFVSGRVIPQMKTGSISEMSIGYSVDEWESENGVRKLKAVTLWETSLVTIPMNPNARITGMKSDLKVIGIDDIKSMTERDLEKTLRSGVSFSQSSAKYLVSALKTASQREVDEEKQRDAALSSGLDKLISAIKRG